MYNNFGRTIILFKADRITYLIERVDEEAMAHLRYLIDTDKDSAKFFELKQHQYYYRLDMVFENANPVADIIPGESHSYFFNYYLAQCPDGILNIYPYQSFTYKNVWDGVDIKFMSDGSGIKYDIILHPGASASQVAFRYVGATALELSDGILTIKNPVKDFQESIPYSYFVTNNGVEEEVLVKYNVSDNVVRFMVPELSSDDKLVIDPAMTWSTYFNFKQDMIWDQSAHARGDHVIYMTRTNDATIPDITGGTGAYTQSTMAGARDLALLMFNSTGELHWITLYGGEAAEYLKGGVNISDDNKIYVVAMSMSDAFPIQNLPGAFNQATRFNYFEDLVVMRFDINGVRDWSTFIQTDYYASNAGMDVGPNNHLYIVGYFELSYRFPPSVPMIDPGGGAYYQATKSTVAGDMGFDHESFVLEFNTSGAMVWATYFGSNGQERLHKIEVADNGTIFCYGNAQTKVTSSPSATHVPKLLNGGGYYDDVIVGLPGKLYMVKFTASRGWVWASLYGGTNGFNNPPGDKMNICSDSQNNIYFVGGTRATDFPLLDQGGGAYYDNVFDGDPSWDSNMYILKFANNTQRTWATFFGGEGWHTRPGCAVDANDHLFVTSATNATDHPIVNQPGSYHQPVSGGGKDGQIAQFSATGQLLWSTYVGGFYTDEELNCLAVLNPASGTEIFAFGRTGGSTSPCLSSWPIVDPGGNAYVDTFPCVDYYQVAISKFSADPCGTPPDVQIAASDTVICAGETVSLSVSGALTYLWSTSQTDNPLVVTPSSTTTYSVTGTDGNGCTAEASVTITVHPLPDVDLIASQTNICIGDDVTLTASGADTYVWSPVGSGSVFVHTPSATTTYTVTGTDANGCENTASVTVNVASQYDATINPAGPFCFDDPPVQLTAANGGGVWSGNGVNSTGLFDPAQAGLGTHAITYTISGSCGDTDTENIIVRDCDNLQYHAVVPSAFSPNGDGENDVLFVRGEGIKTLEFVIYTRWGEKVFETTSKDNGWNGIYKGKPMDPAVYVYSLKVTFDDNTELQHTGDVTLVR
jgi:gliding motility-associated-like protein